MNKEWKIIQLGTSIFKVSRNGKIKRYNSDKSLSIHQDKNGYKVFSSYNRITKKSRKYKVHRIVATLFVGNPKNKKFVNHKDGNKINNNYSNLEWCTHLENMRHAHSSGLVSNKGEMHRFSLLKNNDILDIIECLSDGFKQTDIARYYGVNSNIIWSIANGRSWKSITGIRNGKS